MLATVPRSPRRGPILTIVEIEANRFSIPAITSVELGDQQLLDFRQSFVAVSKGNCDELGERLVPVDRALADTHGRIELADLAKLLHLPDELLGIPEGFLAQGSIQQDSIVNAPHRQKGKRHVDDASKRVDDLDDIHVFTVQSIK